jgi:hypothetical protein
MRFIAAVGRGVIWSPCFLENSGIMASLKCDFFSAREGLDGNAIPTVSQVVK